MRDSHSCPKCNGRRIWHIAEVSRTRDDVPGKVVMSIVAARIARPDGYTYTCDFGGFSTYVCAGCGFTEWYASKLDGLAEAAADSSSGVRLIDASGSGAPYRG